MIAQLDMHHLVFGINFQMYFISLTSLVSIHLLIHLSSHLCHHHHSQHLHCFTPALNLQVFSTNPSHFNRLMVSSGLPSRITGLDRTYYANRFILVRFLFKFSV